MISISVLEPSLSVSLPRKLFQFDNPIIFLQIFDKPSTIWLSLRFSKDHALLKGRCIEINLGYCHLFVSAPAPCPPGPFKRLSRHLGDWWRGCIVLLTVSSLPTVGEFRTHEELTKSLWQASVWSACSQLHAQLHSLCMAHPVLRS